MADWRISVVVENAGGAPVHGARLVRRVWAGGQVQPMPDVTIAGAVYSFDVPETTLNVVCELRHARYATLAMNLVRTAGEGTWRWTNPNRRVRTSGTDVTVHATLGRLRPAPLAYVPEDQLARRARELQATLDEADRKNAAQARRKRPASERIFAPLDFDQPNALVTEDRSAYRPQAALQRVIESFHVAAPALLSDTPEAAGWGRFATTAHRVDPAHAGRLYVLEYGEVGAEPSGGPRFAIGVWVPTRLHDPRVTELDFVVWLHPHTNNPIVMPQVQYPFRQPYPYGLIAVKGPTGTAVASQRFLDIPIFHLLSQHFLAYQLAAARRDAVIVIPVAPSSHFEVFENPSTLMRLLRELCLWIPRDFPRGADAAVHAPPPAVRRVAVSGFSASVPRLHTLMLPRTPEPHYDSPTWWTTSRDGASDDARDFAHVWKEQWAIDGVAGGFPAYTDAAAAWLQQASDRHLRIYKTRFTGGWDFLARRPGAWSTLARRATPVVRGEGAVRAAVASGLDGRWTAASLEDAFVLGPPAGTTPAVEPALLPAGAHELMPRIFFGHAAGMSGLTVAR